MVGVGVVVHFSEDHQTCLDAKIGLGAVAPTPIRALEAERIVEGKKLEPTIIKQCAEAAAGDTCCISDVRCCDEYREEMIRVFVGRALSRLSA
jgi:carbon-monoxide dehydrogenase medium subunit